MCSSDLLNLISLDVPSIVSNNLPDDLKSTIGPDKLLSLSLIEATHWKRWADGTIMLARNDTWDTAMAPILPVLACGALIGGGL